MTLKLKNSKQSSGGKGLKAPCLTVAVRVGPRDVEALHAALEAEEVLGLVAAEGVGLEAVVALHQLEVVEGHDEVLVLLLDANRAAEATKRGIRAYQAF